jgi:hypothetical protein
MSRLQKLQERRAYDCRLTADRALGSLDEAAEFLRDRGLLTWAPDSTLPSLYEALHEDPLDPQRRWWLDALADRDDVLLLRIHRGKPLLVSRETAAIVDPVLRAEIVRMEAADQHWGQLLRYLEQAGPSSLEAARQQLGLKRHEFADVVYPLELCGTIVRRTVVLEGAGAGQTETTELVRWDQVYTGPAPAGGVGDVVVAGVRAAVVTPERAIGRWFSWPWRLAPGLLDRLVAEGRLHRPEPGWVALPD